MNPFSNKAKKRFSLVARAKSFTHAGRGIRIFIASTHNAWIHLVISAMVIVLGIVFGVSVTEWALLVLAMGLVLVAEAINTAIEVDIDLTSPDVHPHAKDTKDVAAGAVLLAVLAASSLAAIIFIPKILPLLT